MRRLIIIACLCAVSTGAQAGIAERIKPFVPPSLAFNVGSTQAEQAAATSPVKGTRIPSGWPDFWSAIDRTLRTQIAYVSIPVVITPTSVSVTPTIGFRVPSLAVPIASAQITK